jgi:pimeloyl-ACP methyl ester carboxylesterase
MLTEHTHTSGDALLNYARGPSAGPPLLLLHGVLRCWQDFLPVIPTLSYRWQVDALDFRGHGRSSPRPGAYRVVDYVEDAVSFLRHGCDEQAVLFGHSLGAMAALAAAAEVPDRCAALVLEDPPFETAGSRLSTTTAHSQFLGMQALAGPNATTAGVARQLADLQLTDPGTGQTNRFGDVRDPASLRFSAHCLTKLDPDVFTSLVSGRWLEGYDLDALLPRVCCPVLLLQGDAATGGMLTDEDAEKLQKELHDCTRIKLPGVGHLIHGTRTETTLRLVTAFLESLDREE